MYDPKGNSRERAIQAVSFVEAEPPESLRSVVHRFLELRTEGTLPEDYRFHALPDACTYAVFDQGALEVAGVTRLEASSEELNLGRSFHFVNIRFLPGVWQLAASPVGYGLVEAPYGGELPLGDVNAQLHGRAFEDQVVVLTAFVQDLLVRGILEPCIVTERIFAQLDDIFSVADMAEVARLSPRQLQRVLKQSTGFSPHDFLKVIRLQQSLRGEPSLAYADQSHFIRSFRRATGYTPGQFSRKFDV